MIIGDTLGDLYKDVSGLSLNIVMKLIAIVSVVFSSFFVKNSLPVLIDSYSA
jgi:K(+)-stimulated pyrophosphate-energized sodium pump